MNAFSTAEIQSCLERLRAGDDAAREALLAGTCDRLRRLASMMLGGYQRLQRWEETDDVMNKAMLRLSRALGSEPPLDARHYYRLATLQIRRELRDMARHYYGPHGLGKNYASRAGMATTENETAGKGVGEPAADDAEGPAKLAQWSELHAKAEQLPDELREVFDLIWYHQVSQVETAETLGISRRTVIRRWQAACLNLYGSISNTDLLSQ